MEALAHKILDQFANDQTIADLSACLNHGNGAMRVGKTGRGLMVLRNPTQVMEPNAKGFLPTIIGFATPDEPKPGAIGSTNFVGRHWRVIAKGLGDQRPEGNYKPWAPVATRTKALIPIGGPVGMVRATTPDIADPHNTYEWHDLTGVPVGAVIYRGAFDGHITAFQRITHGDKGLWVKLYGRGKSTRDYGQTYAAVQEHDFGTHTSDLTVQRPLAFDPEVVTAIYASNTKPSTPRAS